MKNVFSTNVNNFNSKIIDIGGEITPRIGNIYFLGSIPISVHQYTQNISLYIYRLLLRHTVFAKKLR
jgi:hypothetical protein